MPGRAYELDTANKWYGRLYGQMLVRGERYDQARVLYRKLLRDDPRAPRQLPDPAILYQQAGCLVRPCGCSTRRSCGSERFPCW